MNVMFQQQCNEVQVQNNGGFCTVTFSIRITFTEYRTAITKNTKTAYNFMNACNYDYVLYLTLCSRMMLNLQEILLQKQRICFLGHRKIHKR
jgi:collagenase-like PrtC family protease